MMKKYVLGFLVLSLLPLCALAESAAPAATANGMVHAVNTSYITAPFSGTLLPFDWKAGDQVQEGEALFVLDTQKVYAPEEGVFTLFAREGELAEDVIRQYGGLGSIQKSRPYLIHCTTQGAYQAQDTRFVHVGETLYFRLTQNNRITGEGRVIAASPTGYTVEIARDAFELGKRVKLYREESRSSRSCVGEGTLARALEQPVMGSGRVLRCLVQDGETVSKGDLLFETVASDAAPGAEASVPAPIAGVLEALPVAVGQQVYKGQALAALKDLSALKVVAQVDEVDLPRLQMGAGVQLVFDSYPGQSVPGTVTAISSLGTVKQNATYYDVDISFMTQLDVRLRMNATVTLP